jgi:pyridoxal phosphate enzyme (YggS family)
MSSLIAEKIAAIGPTIPPHVRLIAVTKEVSVPAMREAYAAGIRDFGENHLQEAMAKQAQLQDLTDICWHFIGHLQANKAKKAIACFPWIHSVDSLKLAQRLNRLASEAIEAGTIKTPPQVCLQIKVLADPHKYGWSVGQLLADLPILDSLQWLQVRGLMSILPVGLSEAESLAAFCQVREIAAQIQQQNWSNLDLNQLSMGMSADYLLAIKAGATMIRLGRIIFGERQ